MGYERSTGRYQRDHMDRAPRDPDDYNRDAGYRDRDYRGRDYRAMDRGYDRPRD